MHIRYYFDPDTGEPHIYDHGVREEEVEQVLLRRGEDYPAQRGARMKLGRLQRDVTYRSFMCLMKMRIAFLS